jgi:hypothetical protein
MKRFASLCLGVACVALVSVPTAQAHTLTKKKARAALQQVAADLAPTVAPAVAAKLPGATIASSGVGPCAIVKKGHRAECILTFTVQGASIGETECILDAVVQFKSKKSKELKISTGPVVVCVFPVELPTA